MNFNKGFRPSKFDNSLDYIGPEPTTDTDMDTDEDADEEVSGSGSPQYFFV